MSPRASLALVCGSLFASWVGGLQAQAVRPEPEAKPAEEAKRGAEAKRSGDETVTLSPVEVQARNDDAGYDATGLGSYEQQLRDVPFSNDMISADALEDDPNAFELRTELRQVAMPSPVDLATGDTRLALRGFPTPVLRNGFVTMGASDMLNTSRTVTIQGMLVPVLGRAAPGGIQDFITWRPRTTPGKRFDYSYSSLDRQTAGMEWTGPAVPKRAWQRVAADWSRRMGPEEFSRWELSNVSGALTWKHSATVSTLVAIDYQELSAIAAPGILEYRPASGQKIVGPYLPLAGFHAYGPESGVRRRTGAAMVLIDAQPRKSVAVRGGVETWWRQVEQDRFTTSLYNVALGRYEGTREPIHLEQPQTVYLAHLETTVRFSRFGAEHKLMGAASHSWGDYEREERALSVAGRNALPASVRLFTPTAPDYSRPVFTRDTYSRVLADRDEEARYLALELSHRMALQNGRTVVTSGGRHDVVSLRIADRTPGARMPRVADTVGQFTYHCGVNYQAIPSRMLVFATASTAFEPSSRVDVRTGRLQPNEMTRGYEGGAKWRWTKPEIEFTATGFSLFNEDISRPNPRYGHPVFDANLTEPQLVASGEETFRGARAEGRWKPAPPWTVTGRWTYARALTTASPDLPHEVGRPITRLPPTTVVLAASYAVPTGRWKGLSVSGSWVYVSSFVAQHEDALRHRLEFPSYGIFGLGANYAKRIGKYTHFVGLSLRNALDYDFERKHARLGAQRELVTSYRVTF